MREEIKSEPIYCIDCGKKIELPSHRINTNNGYKWICDECKNKIKDSAK